MKKKGLNTSQNQSAKRMPVIHLKWRVILWCSGQRGKFIYGDHLAIVADLNWRARKVFAKKGCRPVEQRPCSLLPLLNDETGSERALGDPQRPLYRRRARVSEQLLWTLCIDGREPPLALVQGAYFREHLLGPRIDKYTSCSTILCNTV